MTILMKRFLLALLVFTLAPRAHGAAQKPNFIIILADDLGWADVGFNGSTEIPTPNIDSIAQNGIVFTSGYVSAPQCAPSRSGLLTGVDQNRIKSENNMTLDIVGLAEGPTFADRMRAAGYRTGIIGKWHLGTQPGKHPLKRGFDEFFGFLGGGSFYFPKDGKPIPKILEGHERARVNQYLTDAFGERAVKFIAKGAEADAQPFFLYLAFNAPHTPLQAPDEEIARFAHIADKNRRIYAAMVSVMDRNIGRVLEAIKQGGIEKSTIVVFLSDNGGPTSVTGASNLPLRGVKGDILEGGVRVPFALQWPGTVKPGQTVDSPVSALDLLPTALAAAGDQVPAGLDGKNLLPAFTGEADYPERILSWRFPLIHNKPETWWWGIRDGNWKLVYFNPRAKKGIETETGLFDLSNDIGEAKDLSAASPEVRERLQKAYDAWAAELPPPFSGLSEEQIEAYVNDKRSRRED